MENRQRKAPDTGISEATSINFPSAIIGLDNNKIQMPVNGKWMRGAL